MYRQSHKFLTLLSVAVVSFALQGCFERYQTHGHKVDPDRLTEVQIGQSNMAEVRDILGPPTNSGSFDRKSMYYIFQFTEHKAFLNPKVLERQIVRVDFDDNEIVKDIKIVDEQQGKHLELVERETPTSGKNLNVFQQMLGNVGKFRKEK